MVHISERERQMPEQEIGKLLQIAVERKDVISLGPGEPDFPAPKPIVALTRKYAGKCNHYSPPGGRKELREAIAKKLRKENRIPADPENIVVTTGSQEALLLAIACTMDVTEEVILPNPSYMGFLPTFQLFNAVPSFVPVREENEFAVDPDDIKKSISKKTCAILINSPANPTGNVLTKKILEEIADIAIEHDLYVFSDEAYEKIVYDDARHVSIGSLNGMDGHAVTLNTFSKTYAMCGYRVGYVCAPPELARAIKETHVNTTICAPTISQMVAAEALKLPAKHTDAMVREYDRRRKMLVKRLNKLGLRTPTPKGAFYTFSNITEYSNNSHRFMLDLLNKAKVAVVPGTEFGTEGEGYIRCSYATDYNLIGKALDRMEKFLRTYRKK